MILWILIFFRFFEIFFVCASEADGIIPKNKIFEISSLFWLAHGSIGATPLKLLPDQLSRRSALQNVEKKIFNRSIEKTKPSRLTPKKLFLCDFTAGVGSFVMFSRKIGF